MMIYILQLLHFALDWRLNIASKNFDALAPLALGLLLNLTDLKLKLLIFIFLIRRPQIGWQTVPRYRMTRGVSDGCSVVTRDLRLGPQVMVIGGRGQGRGVSKLVLSSNQWTSSVARMNHARSHHACMPLTLNGRPGVVVSGGRGKHLKHVQNCEM